MEQAPGRNAILNVCPIPGFTVAETHYQPGEYQAPHEHEDSRLILTVRGDFKESRGTRGHSCGPESILYRPAGERHSNQYGAGGAVCIGIRLGPEWAGILPDHEMPGGSDGSIEMAGLARRLYRELHNSGPYSIIGVQGGVLDILARLRGRQSARCARRAPHWIESAQEMLRCRLKSPPDLAEAARVAGVHPAHFSRVFRQFTGLTVGGYLRRERVQFACSLLQRSRCSLAEIAQEVGFYDQAHFSRAFRRQVGVSPREFRLLHRKQ
jgi:AraC-like DNA-binding protein